MVERERQAGPHADIVPASDHDNLGCLAGALRDLDARLRVEDIDEGLAFEFDATTLRNANLWTLITRFGPLDISLVPSGPLGYDELAARQHLIDYDDCVIAVADLADVIHAKEAADRPQDRLALPTLRQLAVEMAARRQRE